MSAWSNWDAAFRALVQDNNGKPLAALLRDSRCSPAMLAEMGYALTPEGEKVQAETKAQVEVVFERERDDSGGPSKGSIFQPTINRSALIPAEAALALGELLDPQIPWNRFAGPLQAPQMVNGKRLKASIRLEAARKAANDESARLVKKAKRRCEKLDERDSDALEAFAKDHNDERALRALADHKKALREWRAAMAATGRAVRLVIKPLPKKQRELLARNERIVAEMIAAIREGESVSKAAAATGQKLDPKLEERQVTAVWAKARKKMPDFLDPDNIRKS
jgi:hypothetical protein